MQELVNVFNPKDENRIVIYKNELPKYLASGWIADEAYQAQQKVQDEKKQEDWRASPEGQESLFEGLRMSRDARISATDYLMTSDYPISETEKAQVIMYRQALRDLPAQEGAPWDGGGEATPWPEMPTIINKNN